MLVAQRDTGAKHVCTRTELAPPELFADQNDALGSLFAVLGREPSAEHRLDAKHREQAIGHDEAAETFRLDVRTGDVHLTEPVTFERLEERRLRLPSGNLGHGQIRAAGAGRAEEIQHLDQPVGMRERRRSEDGLIDNAEDRGGGANTDADDQAPSGRCAPA